MHAATRAGRSGGLVSSAGGGPSAPMQPQQGYPNAAATTGQAYMPQQQAYMPQQQVPQAGGQQAYMPQQQMGGMPQQQMGMVPQQGMPQQQQMGMQQYTIQQQQAMMMQQQGPPKPRKAPPVAASLMIPSPTPSGLCTLDDCLTSDGVRVCVPFPLPWP